MMELYTNIKQEIKDTAESIWNIAMSYNDPLQIANFLNTIIEYYKHIYTEEEVEFLQFYFQMRMEMMKK